MEMGRFQGAGLLGSDGQGLSKRCKGGACVPRYGNFILTLNHPSGQVFDELLTHINLIVHAENVKIHFFYNF